MRVVLRPSLSLIIAVAVGAAISMFWQHRNRAHSTVSDAVSRFDFALLDTRGNPWQLSRAEARFVVLYVHGVGCPIVRQDLVALQSLARDMAPRGVTFALINANSQDSEDELRADAESLAITLPLLRDDAQLVARTLRIERTGEALVLDRSSGEVRWRGPLDDRVGYGTQRPQASVSYLRDALTAILADERPAAGPAAHGCAITYLAPKAAAPTYVHDVAPILQQHCVHCHSDGGPAPWHMTDYDTVRGFGAMTREVLLTRRMPPWHADTPSGRFRDDPRLSEDELRTLVTWIDDKTPYGDGADPLDHPAEKRPDFSLGQPDLIVSLPPQDIPATGVLPYRFVTLPFGLTKDVWVRATEIRPGDPTLLHHVHLYLNAPRVPARRTLRKQHVSGDRRDHFVAETDLWELLMRISAERKRREIDPTIELLARLKSQIEERKDVPEHVRHRIGRMHEFISTLTNWYDQVRRLPKPTLVTLMKLGAKVAQFIPGSRSKAA